MADSMLQKWYQSL